MSLLTLSRVLAINGVARHKSRVLALHLRLVKLLVELLVVVEVGVVHLLDRDRVVEIVRKEVPGRRIIHINSVMVAASAVGPSEGVLEMTSGIINTVCKSISEVGTGLERHMGPSVVRRRRSVVLVTGIILVVVMCGLVLVLFLLVFLVIAIDLDSQGE